MVSVSDSRREAYGAVGEQQQWRESETQVYLPKDSSTQYAVSKGQTMVRPLRYIAGLRGAPDTRMEVVDVGLDVGQPHEL